MPAGQSRFTFVAKILAALLLVGVADQLFDDGQIGSWLGGFGSLWVIALGFLRPAVRRGPALVALATAACFAFVMMDRPGLLAWVMFWSALSIAALLPRTVGFDDALQWIARLMAHGMCGPFSPIADLARLSRVGPRQGRMTPSRLGALLLLPIIMTALFVALFANANPLIARVLSKVRLPSMGEIVFWLFVLAAVWPSLRPRSWPTRVVEFLRETDLTLPAASLSSVLISLVLFNLVFAIQNGLDLVFLWSDAPLPDGVTLADYAHRGAYPLIVTALLAGIFVLATMRKGSATAASPAVRRLVVLWVAQNLLLVASSILRTCDYIAVYMFTAWRISALLWMGLVGFGLILICWRMLKGRSARWLINGNALAAALVLGACTIIDLDAAAASWNIRHAREAGGNSVPIDLCQLNSMGPSALLPLIELERRPLHPAFRDRLVYVREQALQEADEANADWRRWIWRDARRAERAHALLGARRVQPRPLASGDSRNCDGTIEHFSPPPPEPTRPPAPAAPLTSGAAS